MIEITGPDYVFSSAGEDYAMQLADKLGYRDEY